MTFPEEPRGSCRALVLVGLVAAALLFGGCGKSKSSGPETTAGTTSTPKSTQAAGGGSYDERKFEAAIRDLFNRTAGTNTVNGVSPNVTAVKCPGQVTVHSGATFKCTLSGGSGLTGEVTVTLTDDQGRNFTYAGQGQMVAGGSQSTFPVKGSGSVH